MPVFAPPSWFIGAAVGIIPAVWVVAYLWHIIPEPRFSWWELPCAYSAVAVGFAIIVGCAFLACRLFPTKK